jgi:hypothetical protein
LVRCKRYLIFSGDKFKNAFGNKNEENHENANNRYVNNDGFEDIHDMHDVDEIFNLMNNFMFGDIFRDRGTFEDEEEEFFQFGTPGGFPFAHSGTNHNNHENYNNHYDSFNHNIPSQNHYNQTFKDNKIYDV